MFIQIDVYLANWSFSGTTNSLIDGNSENDPQTTPVEYDLSSEDRIHSDIDQATGKPKTSRYNPPKLLIDSKPKTQDGND